MLHQSVCSEALNKPNHSDKPGPFIFVAVDLGEGEVSRCRVGATTMADAVNSHILHS